MQFANNGIEIAVDLARVLVRIDLEVTEVAALSAEGNVDVDSQRRTRARRAIQGLMCLRTWSEFQNEYGG